MSGAKGILLLSTLQLLQFLFLLYYTQIYRNVHSNNLHAPVCQTLHRIIARMLLFSSFSVTRLRYIPDFLKQWNLDYFFFLNTSITYIASPRTERSIPAFR